MRPFLIAASLCAALPARAAPVSGPPHTMVAPLAAPPSPAIEPVRGRMSDYDRAARRRTARGPLSFGYSDRRERANDAARARRAFGYTRSRSGRY